MKQLFLILFLVSVCTTFAAADLLEGLVLYMPLDEGNGKNTEDFSENGFEGELTGGAKWVDGKFGKALEFSASSDFVAIEDDAAFHIEDEITQAAWINLNRLPSARHRFRHPYGWRWQTHRIRLRHESRKRHQGLDKRCRRWVLGHLMITKPAWIPVNGITFPIPTHRRTRAR